MLLVVHQTSKKFKYSPIWYGIRSIIHGEKHQIAIISMPPPQQPTTSPFSKSLRVANIPFAKAMIFPFFIGPFFLLLLPSTYRHDDGREKNTIPAHKKSIFRTTLDYVIQPDYASIDVACKHRIIREMTKILPCYWHSRPNIPWHKKR